MVVTGGVIGWDAAGVIWRRISSAQVHQTLSNIPPFWRRAARGPEHLVRLTWYVVDMEEYLANLKDARTDLS